MDGKQLRRLRPELEMFLQRYLPLFGRSENHAHADRFVQGLLGGHERRNVENVAEAVDGGVVRTMQKFVAQRGWHCADVLGQLRMHVAEAMGGLRWTPILGHYSDIASTENQELRAQENPRNLAETLQ